MGLLMMMRTCLDNIYMRFIGCHLGTSSANKYDWMANDFIDDWFNGIAYCTTSNYSPTCMKMYASILLDKMNKHLVEQVRCTTTIQYDKRSQYVHTYACMFVVRFLCFVSVTFFVDSRSDVNTILIDSNEN
jgi:hypothetical protein